jgi:two-component system, OmpR family, sensor histidine kinase TctE
MRSRMLWRVLLPLALIWVIGSVTAFAVAHFFTIEAFDRALVDDARAFAAYVIERDGQLVLDISDREVRALLPDKDEKEFFSVWGADGSALAGNAVLPPSQVKPGKRWEFSDGSYQGAELRMVTLSLRGAGSASVVVAQTTQERRELLRRLGAYSRLPQAALILLLGWWLYRTVGRELAPLERLQAALAKRDSTDLSPLNSAAPSLEVERLAQAINELMLRIGRGVQAQREFTGNVAHELRTPLAGIRALAEYGLAHSDPAIWKAQLRSIASSQERASHLVDQLLALALADEARDTLALGPVRVDEITRNAVLTQLPRADAQGVDLGALGLDEPMLALGNTVLIEGALNNLIDNALRHGCLDGAAEPAVTVEVRRHEGRVSVSVTDNGPGIDAAQRERQLQRWAQGHAGATRGGAGLGLAIVARYATILGATLTLATAPGGRGLCATLTLQTPP